MEPEVMMIERGEVRLKALVVGDDGPAVVLLHGLAGSSRELVPTAEALRPRFRTILLDQRGHGGSTRRPADTSREAFVAASPGTAPTTAGGCVIRPLAEATMTWTIPHRPGVLTMRDTGATPDASGTVAEPTGIPVRYVTGKDDTISGAAQRLGTTVGVLLYLDPNADLPNPWSRLPAGETLTLTANASQ